jgi:glycosyltransferase involved in cell wall biosynthesis
VPELVLLADQLLADVPGGTGRYTRQLGAALARTAPDGWTLSTVVTKHRDISAAVIPGAAQRMLPWPRRMLTAAWEKGVPLWPGGDSVHAPTPFAPPRATRGLVVTVHDTVPFTHPQTLTRRGASWHRRMIIRAAQRADAIVTPTEAVAAELSHYAPGPVSSHVIGHGVSAALVRPPAPEKAAAVARRLRLPPRYVLMIGTIEPRKGVDVLIAALARRPAPSIPLVLAGPRGWGDVDPVALAAGAGIENPLLLGELTDEELSVVLHGASMLVSPSMAEGFGLPLLEAMAAGVPVVHSDVPALVEVVGGTGIAVRRGDAFALAGAVRAVLDDPAATAARVVEAKSRAASFGWDDAAAKVWDLHRRNHQARDGR